MKDLTRQPREENASGKVREEVSSVQVQKEIEKEKHLSRKPTTEKAQNMQQMDLIRESVEELATRQVSVETESASANKQKKTNKAKNLSRELAAEKARNARLLEELKRSQQINEELMANQTERDGDVYELERETRFSSTRRTPGAPNWEESRFYTSMNQLSIASVSIPECKPAEDGEIHRQCFEAWKDLLLDSMVLAGVNDEVTMFTIFKVKAGPKLLEIFKNTKSSKEDPNADYFPFTNAMSRLKSYFGSGSDVMLLRRRLALLSQKPDESDLSYITRVGSMARLCEFDDSKEFEQIVATVSEHATNREVRTASLKMLSRNQNFTDLVDKVREIEAIKLNEDFVRKKYEKSEQALVATVGASFPKGPSRKFDYKPQRVSQNYGGRSFRGSFRAQRTGQIYAGSSPSFRSTRGEKCWRCHSPYHGGNDCSHKDKRCNYCGILGHIQRACRSHRHMSGIKRPTDLMEDAPQSRKIAAIEEVKDDAESDQTVSEPNGF